MAKRIRISHSWLLTTLAGAGFIAGCAGDARTSGTLTAADFRAPDADRAPEVAAMSERRAPAYTIEQVPPEDAAPVAVLHGAPKLEPVASAPAASSGPVMMDALVGDINGAPIYANTFFTEAIAARLSGLAADPRMSRQAWLSEARSIIGARLVDLVRDQLLLAEAKASLSPEQKQGLLAFIEHVRKDLVSRGGGGQAAVDEWLREQGEEGLEAKLKGTIDQQLIAANYREKILPRATVSWHEVEIEYERRAEQFNPDPIAVFRMIWIPNSKTDLIEQVKSELARGVPFEEIAARPENEAPRGGEYQQSYKGEYSKAELFGPKELTEAAQGLSPGDVAGPIVVTNYTRWIKLERIETPRAVSIYEAQLAIYRELRDKKVNAEVQKYIANLMGKQSMDRLAEMGEKLVRIAADRYYTGSR